MTARLTVAELGARLATPAGRAALLASGDLLAALHDPALRPVVLAAFREHRAPAEAERTARDADRRRAMRHAYHFTADLPLVPEPTPRAVAADGLRHRVSPPTWAELRRLVLREWAGRCAVCRATPRAGEALAEQQARQAPLVTLGTVVPA